MGKKELFNPEGKLFDFSEVLPHLYVSGYGCITEQKLKQFGITHAVDATNIPSAKKIPGINYLEVPVDDSVIAKISPFFDACSKFIEEARAAGGKTLVYCAAGISRSAALVIAYLVQTQDMTLRDAFQRVNQVRPIIAPNNGFWHQLIQFEQQVRGDQTVKLISGRTRRPVPDVYLHRSLLAA